MQRYAEEAGRDPASVALTVRARLPLNEPPRAVEQLQAYREVGVSHVVVEIFTLDLEQARSLMEVLAREVRPKVAA
ncbi:MAG: hypothetical protein A2148_00740 [Chloroflexi bacterium RBG_16_68_14]|nr:MAG: hypothetical protein A2148_00740 [Chloroflexi bacterium RBG_16_68_14]